MNYKLIFIFLFILDETLDKSYSNGNLKKDVSQNGCSDNEVSKCISLKLVDRNDISQLNAKTSAKISTVIKDEALRSSITKNAVKKTKSNAKTKINKNFTAKNKENTKPNFPNGILVRNSDESEDDISAEKGELEANGKLCEKKDDQDVVFIQDVGFTIKIQSPGTEIFDIQVNDITVIYRNIFLSNFLLKYLFYFIL